MPKVNMKYILTYLLGNANENHFLDSFEGFRFRVTHSFVKFNVHEGRRYQDSLRFGLPLKFDWYN
jgi:hypothetical protein